MTASQASPAIPAATSASDEGTEHSAWPAVHCWRCGGVNVMEACVPDAAGNGCAAAWSCAVCDLNMVGGMDRDIGVARVNMFWLQHSRA